MVDITKNFVTECLLKVQTFLNQYAEKCSAVKWYIDGWIKLQKREKIQFTYEDVRYHLDCWLVVTKIQACWFSAIVTTISSIIY